MKSFANKVENILNKIKIKKSLSYLFVFVFFIPFVIISSFFVLMLYNTMHDWELKRAQSNLEITEEKFTDILSNVTLISDRIYINKRIQKILTTEFTEAGQVYDAYSSINYLEDYLHTYKEVDSFRIYTQNSTLLENQFIQKVTPAIKKSEWYNNAKEMKGRSFWTYKEDSIKKKKYLCMVRAIYNTLSDEFLGVLVINVNPYSIQETLRDKTITTFIVFDYTIIYSSSDTSFSLYEQPLIKYLYQYDYSISKMTNMIIGDERVGVVAVDFYPINSVSLKFEIINVIPIKQLVSSTLKVIYLTLIILTFIIILLILALAIYSGYIDIRVNKIDQQIEHIFENNFEIAKSIGGNDEFEQIYKTIQNMAVNTNYLITELRRQTDENTSLALQQSEISFKMLSNQINPHFLFNTLETIRMKAISASDKEVANMLKLLASLLRYNLSVRGKPVPLYNELEAIQNYLAIQHMRFGNRISYDIVTMCDVNKLDILPLLIQPIVENSFSHGLEDKVSGGFIYIIISSENVNNCDRITICVKDNGIGISKEKLEEIKYKLNNYKKEDSTNSIGLINVQSRIKMYYGPEFGITINSDEGEGTEVIIKI